MDALKTVFVLHHTHRQSENREDVKLIGIYSSEAQAHAAIERMRTLPGFRDVPDGFEISRYPIDQDHWTSGYVTM